MKNVSFPEQNKNIPLLEMKGIEKKFGTVLANSGVDFIAGKGMIHALVGENGAGKTTLMNILYGLYHPDKGEIKLNGSKVSIRNSRDAINLGIGMVHQHFMLISPLTVTENIILGRELIEGPFLDYKRADSLVASLSGKYGLAVDPRARIEELSVGMEQRVEILKILYRDANLLIFDEPTAVLTPQETKELFQIFRNLKEAGKTIIFITHKLEEVLEITDKITVMRQGKVTGTLPTNTATKEEIACLMVGRDVVLQVDKKPANPGIPVLQVERLSALNDRKLSVVKDVSFEVRSGEILGIAGVAGNGQTELVEVLGGLRHPVSGSIWLNGKNVAYLDKKKRFNAGMAYSLGIAHIPEDRHKRGLILDFSIAENAILGRHNGPPFSKNGILNFSAIRQVTKNLISQYDVRTPGDLVPARSLSGGNQQKIIIGRELSRNPSILIVAQPTRGVDVGAIEFIHKELIARRDEGKAILLVSMELDEILSLSDRIAVMYCGEIVAILDAASTNEEELGLLMAGGRRHN